MAWCWTFFVTLGAAERFITCVGSFMSLYGLIVNICSHTGSNWMVYNWFGLFHVSSNCLMLRTGSNWMVYHHCGFFLVHVQNHKKISRSSSRVLSCKLKIELTYYIGISNVLFLIRTQLYWTSPIPSHWIPFYSYIHSYIHGFLVLSIPSESDCLLIFCLSHIGTIPVSKFSL